MAQRKLQQEIDRCFKKVAEGSAAFDAIYDKLQSTSNAAQKEKLEDSLKKEIKKLQRSRDQIKAWAATNDIKDKKPLLEQRKLIESQMEKFKAVEKEMKTKAFSKEGLSAGAKLDPKEKEKLELCNFLSNMVEDLERQIEAAEAEQETLQSGVKKGKKDAAKSDRLGELEETIERHKWHQGKLELLLRTLENGGIETDKVKEIEEAIEYYVKNNQEADFMDDDTIYDDLNLDQDEDAWGMNNEAERQSSQENQSLQDDDYEKPPAPSKQKEPPMAPGRRPSQQLKSPLPALATLHTPSLPTVSNGVTANSMKPAPPPIRAPGEPLKYASAAAAGVASDRNGVGIAPLPPPPGVAQQQPAPSASVTGHGVPAQKQAPAASPAVSHSQPASTVQTPGQKPAIPAPNTADSSLASKSPAPSHSSVAVASTAASSIPPTPAVEKSDGVSLKSQKRPSADDRSKASQSETPQPVQTTPVQTNGDTPEETEEESIFHLPASLSDLLESFEQAKSQATANTRPIDEQLLAHSRAQMPDTLDSAKPNHYRPTTSYQYANPAYPQEPLNIFDDPRFFARFDPDTLFFAFYYRQGTYQQYLAARQLKQHSWRFHKQYQTWFQRHEEPKSITEEYEQGTYRFFDYESTWMNRRKADFKFAYKFLEDDL